MVCSTCGHSSQQRQVGAANTRPLLHTYILCAHVPRHANGVAPVLVQVHRTHLSATHRTAPRSRASTCIAKLFTVPTPPT